MNIVCILAGGAGNRFRSAVPKQYHMLNGRPVIEYVIDAALKSQADEVLIVCGNNYREFLGTKYGVETIDGGNTRNESIACALRFIKSTYHCDKVLLVDAVCPMITSGLIDLYFSYLGEYDAVFTTSEINTSIGSKGKNEALNPNDFFLIQSPDAYRFCVIDQCFDGNAEASSPMYQLPYDVKIKYYYDFRDYVKIVYPQDVAIAEALLREKDRQIRFKSHGDDEVLALLGKLRKMDACGTKKWERVLDQRVEQLFLRWGIYEFNVNPDAYTGLVLECASRKYGAVVVKMYPDFLRKRYLKESYVMRTLSNYHQCTLMDYDEQLCVMLLERVIPGDYIEFERDKDEIADMFRDMWANRRNITDLEELEPEIRGIISQACDEFHTAKEYGYCPQMVGYLLDQAIKIYDATFADEDKYLLHGDAYFKNALRGDGGVEIIDPVGYQDAFVFEYMPFLTYELFYHSDVEHYLEDYEKLVGFFSSFADTSEFKKAVFVFLVKQLIPSIYEANDNFKRADGYMGLIRELYLDENNLLRWDKIEVLQ